ncbi:hypothetical protein BDZ97DRAFT_1656402, partial [Flammula alnicola]
MSAGANDFPHLRRTNAVPSPSERNVLRGLISDIDDEISNVDLSILELQQKLDGVRTQRAGLQELRKTCAGIVSPLRHLPLEIFGQIFVHASEDDPSFGRRASHVCQLWRQASLTTSELW